MDSSMWLSVVRVWIVILLQNKCVQGHLENIPEFRKSNSNNAQKEGVLLSVFTF